MNQRDVKRHALTELAGIVSEMEAPRGWNEDDSLRHALVCGDLFMEFRRRAGEPVSVTTHVEGQIAMEIPE